MLVCAECVWLPDTERGMWNAAEGTQENITSKDDIIITFYIYPCLYNTHRDSSEGRGAVMSTFLKRTIQR